MGLKVAEIPKFRNVQNTMGPAYYCVQYIIESSNLLCHARDSVHICF
jgi:hypothetical protein